MLASEAGVLPDVAAEHVSAKGRLEPGRMFLVDTAEGRIVPDDEIKHALAAQHPYRQWVEGNSVHMNELPAREHVNHSYESVLRRQRAFGYTEEDIKLILNPMADTGKEPLGSMGNDTPMAVLSDRSRMLFDYFTQKFAQVTNPPLDWERERIVTCLESAIGPEPNLLEDTELHAKKILIPLPVINSEEMAQLKRLDRAAILDGYYRPFVVKGLYQVAGGGPALESRLDEIFADIDRAIADGANFIVLSDRGSTTRGRRSRRCCSPPRSNTTCCAGTRAPRSRWPWRPATCERSTTSRCSSPYGAACVNPYLAFETVEDQAPPRLPRGRCGHGRDECDARPVDRRAQDHEQDGRLHHHELPRRPAVRGGRPEQDRHRPVLHRHHLAGRRHRTGRDRRGGGPPPPRGLSEPVDRHRA